MKVLVVDDDALAGEMIAAVLEGMGHEAVLAEDGVDAVGRRSHGVAERRSQRPQRSSQETGCANW